MAITDAVVLAAGEGRRLRPMTYNRPKPMLPAAHRPILEHVFDSLIEAGIDRLAIVVGYRGGRVKSHFGPTYRDIALEYIDQRKQLGSAHALLQAANATVCTGNDRFLVVNGDQLYAPRLIECVATADADSTLALGIVRSDRAADYGAVRMVDDRIVEFVERPTTDTYRLLNSGVYSAGPTIFETIGETDRRNGELAMPDVVKRILATGGDITGIRSEGWWDDATYPWDLLRLTETVLESGRIGGPGERTDSGAWIADSASVHETATIRPPVAIGPEATVGPMTVLGPTVAIGRNTTIGAGCVLERSVIDADSRVGPGSTLVEAVLGQGVTLGPANTITGGPADVRIGTRIHPDRPLGALLADRVRTHGGVSFGPGTLVGPNVRIAAGTSVDGVIDRGTEVS